jgi:Na+/H+-dicarboxylate symporter
MLANLGVELKFSHSRDINCVSLVIKKKRMNQIIPLLIAIVTAVGIGTALRIFTPDAAQILYESAVTPFFNMFIGFITAIAIPFIFISTAWGLYSMSEAGVLGKFGKTLFGGFIFQGLLATFITGAILFFTINFATDTGGAGAGQLAAVFAMLMDIIPSNIIGAFVNANPLQIIFLAVITGFILIKLRSTSFNIASVFREANDIFNTLLEFVGLIIPVFVFVSILDLILSGAFIGLSGMWLVFAVFFGAILIMMFLQTIIIPVRLKVSPFNVYKRIAHPVLIGLFTASSTAALPAAIESCEKKLGVNEKLVKAGLPLGIIFHKPGDAIVNAVLMVFCANMFGVSITVSSFILLLLTAYIFSIATPPVAGSAGAVYALLFMQVGIPLEALTIAITLNVVLDFIVTAFNMGCVQTELLYAARKTGIKHE